VSVAPNFMQIESILPIPFHNGTWQSGTKSVLKVFIFIGKLWTSVRIQVCVADHERKIEAELRVEILVA